MNTNESDSNGGHRRISGRDLKRIREKCGYSAREFANLLCSIGARITTGRSIYRLEEMPAVPFRYVDAMIQLVGIRHYAESLNEVLQEEKELDQRREEREGRRKI